MPNVSPAPAAERSAPPESRRRFLHQLSLAGLLVSGGACLHGQSPGSRASRSSALDAFAVAPSAPLDAGPGGLDIRTLVHSAQTNGQFSCVETAVAPRKMGPAPHLHQELDELMYVLEGTVMVWMAGEPQAISAGGWHFRPRRVPHTFWNATDRPARFVDMYFNQNFEDFLEELFHEILPAMAKDRLTPQSPAIARRIDALNQRFGVVMYPEQRQPLIEAHGLQA